MPYSQSKMVYCIYWKVCNKSYSSSQFSHDRLSVWTLRVRKL